MPGASGNQADQVVVAGSGTVYTAPAATAVAPTNVAATVNAVFSQMGYVSEEGATFTEGKEIADISAWQSFFPIRKLVTSRAVTVSFALREWNKRTIQLALGGTVSINAAEWKYVPPAPSALDERALLLEWLDGTKKYRLYIPRGIVTEAVETNLTRTAAADLPITFSATDPGAGIDIYTIFTNDPSFSS